MCRSCMRRGFTLMEMMVSVVLIVIISLFLTQSITSLQRSNISLKAHDTTQEERFRIFSTLYYDLIESSDIKVILTKERRYHLLMLRTSHSYYRISEPYVLYYVRSDTLDLIRIESADPIPLPIPYEQINSFKADILAHEVSDFNLYSSQKSKKKPVSTPTQEHNATSSSTTFHLLYLNGKTLQKPILFELSHP